MLLLHHETRLLSGSMFLTVSELLLGIYTLRLPVRCLHVVASPKVNVLPRELRPCVLHREESRSPQPSSQPGHRQPGPQGPVGLQAVGGIELNDAADCDVRSATCVGLCGPAVAVVVAVAVAVAVALAPAAAEIGGCAIV